MRVVHPARRPLHDHRDAADRVRGVSRDAVERRSDRSTGGRHDVVSFVGVVAAHVPRRTEAVRDHLRCIHRADPEPSGPGRERSSPAPATHGWGSEGVEVVRPFIVELLRISLGGRFLPLDLGDERALPFQLPDELVLIGTNLGENRSLLRPEIREVRGCEPQLGASVHDLGGEVGILLRDRVHELEPVRQLTHRFRSEEHRDR